MGPAYFGVIRALTVSGNPKVILYGNHGVGPSSRARKAICPYERRSQPDGPFLEGRLFLTRRLGVRFLSKSLGFLCQPIRKRQYVLETASLHGATPFRVKAGAVMD
jgi:hypothetical protein